MNFKKLLIFIILAVLLSDCSTSIPSNRDSVSSTLRSSLTVIAVDAIGLPTRIYCARFNFKIIAVEKLAANLYKYWEVGDTIGFTMYQGADYQNGKDAIKRLSDFLHAQIRKSTNANIESIYSFEESRPLHLEVIHIDYISDQKSYRYNELGSWRLINADGDSLSINTLKSMIP
jgi:hypothetical protein